MEDYIGSCSRTCLAVLTPYSLMDSSRGFGISAGCVDDRFPFRRVELSEAHAGLQTASEHL